MFRIYDYTNAPRLFGHPLESRGHPSRENQPPLEYASKGEGVRETTRETDLIRVEGFDVHIMGEGRAIVVEQDGRETLMPVEEYEQRLAEKLTEVAPSLDDLRTRWIWPDRRRELLERLPGDGASVRLLRHLRDQEACDLYDVLAELAYGAAACSRAERPASFAFKPRPRRE